jgi:hypothetical protein
MLAYLFLCILAILEHFRPRRQRLPNLRRQTRSQSMSAAHVQYGDAIHPVTSNGGGVFPLRSRQNTGVGSLHKPNVTVVKSVDDDLEGEDDGFDERDIKKKQV